MILFPTDQQILCTVWGDYECLKPLPKRDCYYRFRVTSKELSIIKENKLRLKKEYDLNMSQVLRFFSLNCVNFDILCHLGLLNKHPKVLKYRFKAI